MRQFLVLGLLLTISVLHAASPTRVSPTVKEVTVYRSGAKLTSVARVSVPAGKSELIFENLTPYFNPGSLQVRLGGNTTLDAAIFQAKAPAPVPELPRIRIIRDSIVVINDLAQTRNDEFSVLQAEETLLSQKALQIGATDDKGQTKLDVNQLRELTDFYRQRMLEIRKELQKIQLLQRKYSEHVQRLNDELQRLYPNTSNSTGEIVMKIESPIAQTIEVACTYLAYQASWSPLYDLRSEGLDKPLKLIYKANVSNLTGFDWKDVRLKLSTAMPLVNNNRPLLTPIFVDFRIINAYRQEQERANDLTRSLSNMYQMKEAAPSAPGSPLDDEVMAIVTEEEPDNFLSTFDIAKPQDIPSDGQANTITVDERDMAASYQYHAVPKLDPSVFLLAKVPDYGKYNLLPGTANIFFNDTYVGQTTVNPNVTSDTLLLSLGRDEQITIKRVQPKDFTERKKILSNSIKETYAYEISVRNNKALPIEIEIVDQVPVSRQADIQVELLDKDGAEYTETYGKLLWKLDVKPGTTKKVKFSYSIKYPKDKNVSILKS